MLDSVLVSLMIFETWVLALIGGRKVNVSMLRLLCIMRLTRLSRIMRAVPELVIFLKGMMEACRNVSLTLCLLTSILYIFADALFQMTEVSNTVLHEKYFATIRGAMLTLYVRVALLDNIADLLEDASVDTGCFTRLLVAVVIISMTLMNLLMGVVLEVVGTVAKREKGR